jgi:hypothetical protein
VKYQRADYSCLGQATPVDEERKRDIEETAQLEPKLKRQHQQLELQLQDEIEKRDSFKIVVKLIE